MGTCKSKAADKDEEHTSSPPDHTKISCWTGFKKIFSRSRKTSSQVPDTVIHTTNAVETDELDDSDYDDDVELLQITSEVPVVTVNAFVSTELQESKSASALIGLWTCKQTPTKAVEDLPSSSYPKDVRVPPQDFLFYHRFVNDDERDDESVSSYVESHVDDGDADIESNADDVGTSVIDFVYSEDEYTDNECVVDQEDRVKDSIAETSEEETSSVIDQNVTVKKDNLVKNIMQVEVTQQTDEDSRNCLSSCVSADDVTSDDGTTSQDEEGCVDEIEIMFVISLFLSFIHNAFYGIVQILQDIIDDGEDDMDVDREGTVVISGKPKIVLYVNM